MPEQFTSALTFFQTAWSQLAVLLPRLFAALVLLLAGWLVAKLIRKFIIRVFKFARVDTLAEKAGIDDFLLQGDVKYTTITIIANGVYWVIMFAVMLAVLDGLGLRTADDLFAKVLWYIPNIIVALLVLVFGTLLARFFRGLTYTYLSNIGISGAEIVSHIAQWALLLFVVSLALEQLSLGGQVLVSAFEIAFGAVCLALAIAFGLGGKAWAERILEKFWNQKTPV
jgi:hypothetical protein